MGVQQCLLITRCFRWNYFNTFIRTYHDALLYLDTHLHYQLVVSYWLMIEISGR